jgi:hypothetical protein
MSNDAVEELERWLASGGEVRVLAERRDELVVGLFTCDGGELMGQVAGPAAALRPLLDGGEWT